MLIPFPNVPALPGVPPLPRLPVATDINQYVQRAGQALSSISSVTTLLTGDDPFALGASQTPTWGIYDQDGNLLVEADAVVEFDHVKDWRISDYPVEPNAFASYNKVETPYEEHVVFAKGGTDADRADFLAAIDAAVSSLDLYTVMTPDTTYESANLIHYDYRRNSRNGVTLLIVDIAVRQVRVTASSKFTNTKSPASASVQSGGTVQPAAPTAAQLSAIPQQLRALQAQTAG